MNFPSLSDFWALLLKHYAKLRASLGGAFWLLCMIVFLLLITLTNPLLKLAKLPQVKWSFWQNVGARYFQTLTKQSAAAWKRTLERSASIDAEAETPDIKASFAGAILEWKHQQLDWWLLTQGLTDPEIRLRLIQAVVLYRRFETLVQFFTAPKA
jgi:hypothetical protein